MEPGAGIECTGRCITAADIGMPEISDMYAVDGFCELHGSPEAAALECANDDHPRYDGVTLGDGKIHYDTCYCGERTYPLEIQ